MQVMSTLDGEPSLLVTNYNFQLLFTSAFRNFLKEIEKLTSIKGYNFLRNFTQN